MSDALRVPRDEDAPTVAAMMSEHAFDPVDEKWVLRSWTSPTVDRDRDVRLASDGYALIEDIGEGRSLAQLAGRASGELMDWVELRASEIGRRLLSGCAAEDRDIARALAERGFRPIRNAHRMVRDLSEPPAEPSWPAGTSVRTFHDGDARVFYDVQHESFRDHWEPVTNPYEEWAHFMFDARTFEPELWFLAEVGADPAGIAICAPYPTDPELGWVKVLGVRRSFRGRGLGRALLLHAFSAFRSRGFARAGLGVDAENITGATRLYESVGMRVSHRFDLYEKELS